MADDKSTVLILAGDIGVIHRRAELESFLCKAANQFRAIVYVLGNHEFYRGVWPDAMEELRAWGLPENIYVLERQWVQIDDITFLGATLWADFDGEDLSVMLESEQTLSDSHYIRVNRPGESEPSSLGSEMTLADHKQTVSWLDTTLSEFREQGKRCVLVTHHGVSRLSIHETYRDNPVNGAFVSDCTDLLARTCPELVVHGHVHNSFDYMLGTIPDALRVIVNPRGYTRSDETQENPLFDPCLSLTLE